ncbi:MAG: N-acetyltransferase [Armatimonadetes bacterium]|nr:N-acetyltransferase [Candidatus Hippobium faecium]
MNYIIRTEKKEEEFFVENLTRETFWNVYRPGCEEHYVLHQIRKDPCFIPELNLVLEYEGNIIAHVVFVKCKIQTDKGNVPILSFGPLTVDNGCRYRGVGTYLLNHALNMAKNMGWKACTVIGNPKFYSRFGFECSEKYNIYFEDSNEFFPEFQIMELEKNSLMGVNGRFYEPKVYYQPKEEIEAFDRLFVPKKKMKLPGQLV